MHDEDIVRVPLRARDGSVRAYALIDATDSDFVNQWRWSLNDSDGYAVRGTEVGGQRQKIYLHRALLGLIDGDGIRGDHKNRNRLDCRRRNLRAVSELGNRQNVSGHSKATSKFRGVSWDQGRGKWKASLSTLGRYVYIGRFSDESEAAEAVRTARLRLMPFTIEEAPDA